MFRKLQALGYHPIPGVGPYCRYDFVILAALLQSCPSQVYKWRKNDILFIIPNSLPNLANIRMGLHDCKLTAAGALIWIWMIGIHEVRSVIASYTSTGCHNCKKISLRTLFQYALLLPLTHKHSTFHSLRHKAHQRLHHEPHIRYLERSFRTRQKVPGTVIGPTEQQWTMIKLKIDESHFYIFNISLLVR